jgi:hypothetical protein
MAQLLFCQVQQEESTEMLLHRLELLMYVQLMPFALMFPP